MTIRRIDQGERMSQAVVHNGVCYIAGQVAEGPDTAAQTRAILARIDELLADAGTDKSSLLSVTIWLADIADFAEMNAVWDDWVKDIAPPARATAQCGLALPAFRIEVIAVAAVASD